MQIVFISQILFYDVTFRAGGDAIILLTSISVKSIKVNLFRVSESRQQVISWARSVSIVINHYASWTFRGHNNGSNVKASFRKCMEIVDDSKRSLSGWWINNRVRVDILVEL